MSHNLSGAAVKVQNNTTNELTVIDILHTPKFKSYRATIIVGDHDYPEYGYDSKTHKATDVVDFADAGQKWHNILTRCHDDLQYVLKPHQSVMVIFFSGGCGEYMFAEVIESILDENESMKLSDRNIECQVAQLYI